MEVAYYIVLSSSFTEEVSTYETCIQIKYKSSHIYCREEIGVYAHYAYTPINYMKIEIILFYSVQIYRILYN